MFHTLKHSKLAFVAALALVMATVLGGKASAAPQSRSLTRADISRFAPVVRLHPLDSYGPMDPMDFIRISRFRHHRSFWRDQGYSRTRRKWKTTNSHHSSYYNIPLSTLSAYGMHGGKNRRPRDSNSGSSYNVFLEPDSNPRGQRYPNGRIPVFYHYRRVGSLHKVQYWWFFGYNKTPVPGINHQGDWEHVTVHIRNLRIIGVYYSAHKGGRYHRRSRIRMHGTHPIVYIAWGTHAAYPTSGVQTYPLGWGLSFVDHTANGYRWFTHLKLRPLYAQPWKNYAGAWGEVGYIATTTGPLGPWHKRYGR